MKYSYLLYNTTRHLFKTFHNFDDVLLDVGDHIKVIDNTGKVVTTLTTEEDFIEWRVKLERDAAWKPEVYKEAKWDPFDSKETDIQVKPPTTEAAVVKYLGKTPVNPKHYQGFFVMPEVGVGLQWIESRQYLSKFKDPEVFKAAVWLQADKYLSRLGGKDNEVQEIMKGIWYLKFLAAYIKNGNKPIRVVDIESILGDEI